MNLNEQVARFIARYRTKVAKYSVQTIDEFIDYYKGSHCGRIRDPDRKECEERIKNLQQARAKIIGETQNEEERYQELIEQDVLAQFCRIQGVKSVKVSTYYPGGAERLEVVIQAYYLYMDKIYDAGKWRWTVPEVCEGDNCLDVYEDDEADYIMSDGRLYVVRRSLVASELLEDIVTIYNTSYKHPLYSHAYADFCFGGYYNREISRYLLAGEFISAFQLISLCLHHINEGDEKQIPRLFEEVRGVDVHDSAEYFDLDDEDIIADNTQVMSNSKVRIADGADRQPIVVDYVQGETYEQLFKRAGVELDDDHIATIGKGTIKDLNRPVESGTTITIANTPCNGA